MTDESMARSLPISSIFSPISPEQVDVLMGNACFFQDNEFLEVEIKYGILQVSMFCRDNFIYCATFDSSQSLPRRVLVWSSPV